jgi:hypothetical protein
MTRKHVAEFVICAYDNNAPRVRVQDWEDPSIHRVYDYLVEYVCGIDFEYCGKCTVVDRSEVSQADLEELAYIVDQADLLNRVSGEKIVDARLDCEENKFCLMLESGTRLEIKDVAEKCCEKRYMYTDDNPQDLVGAKLVTVYVKPTDNDLQFVDIVTDQITLTLRNYNVHNGWYAGFDVRVTEAE